MPRLLKAYLPRWIMWIIMPMLLLIWGMLTYSVFRTASGREELGIVGWLLMTAVFLLIGVMIWLMASRRLPAYLVELEDGEPDKR